MRKGMLTLTVAALALTMVIGCQQHRSESGYHDYGRTQVQFFAPPGAAVTMAKSCMGNLKADRTHQVGTYGDRQHKLEVEPEQTATFNLDPGNYEFKYSAAGWNGVSVYGELEVCRLSFFAMPGAKAMLKRCFVPIALPAPASLDAVTTGDDMYPYQASARRLRISHQDVERLAQGDMITKVVFVADLKNAKEQIDELEVGIATMKGQRQRLQALLNEAQMDWLEQPESKKFIKLQAELVVLDQQLREAQEMKDRLQSLLLADKVLTRREMLVLATDELLPKHEDPVVSARKLGQVVLIMRIGGRHGHWGSAAQEGETFVK